MERLATTMVWRMETFALTLVFVALLAAAVLGLAWVAAALGVDLAPMGIGTSPGLMGIGTSPGGTAPS